MFTMENNESDYLLLSGIQHFQFCQRQWALIHIEQQWAENLKTIEGQYIHKKADQPFFREKRGNKIIVRAMPICSHELKTFGICDVVEFVKHPEGVHLQGEEGTYLPVPIEHKRGRPKKGQEDVVQLVGQAMCLEEMLVCEIKTGYIYYYEIKHRIPVEITEELREEVRKIFKLMHQYFEKRYTPKVKTGKFCNSCSLKNICLPEALNKEPVRKYMERFLE